MPHVLAVPEAGEPRDGRRVSASCHGGDLRGAVETSITQRLPAAVSRLTPHSVTVASVGARSSCPKHGE